MLKQNSQQNSRGLEIMYHILEDLEKHEVNHSLMTMGKWRTLEGEIHDHFIFMSLFHLRSIL